MTFDRIEVLGTGEKSNNCSVTALFVFIVFMCACCFSLLTRSLPRWLRRPSESSQWQFVRGSGQNAASGVSMVSTTAVLLPDSSAGMILCVCSWTFFAVTFYLNLSYSVFFFFFSYRVTEESHQASGQKWVKHTQIVKLKLFRDRMIEHVNNWGDIHTIVTHLHNNTWLSCVCLHCKTGLHVSDFIWIEFIVPYLLSSALYSLPEIVYGFL